MIRFSKAALSLLAVALLAGCGDDPGDDPGTIQSNNGGAGQGGSSGAACLPGQQVECACPATPTKGVQICKEDGKGLGPCTGCTGAGGAGSGGTSGKGGAGISGSSGQGGAGQGGSGQGGAGQGGAGQGGAGQGGSGAGGEKAGSGQGGLSGSSGQGGAGQAGSGLAGAGPAGTGGVSGEGGAGQAGSSAGEGGAGTGAGQAGAGQAGQGGEGGSGLGGAGGAGLGGAGLGGAGQAGSGLGGAGEGGAGAQAGSGAGGAGLAGSGCGQDTPPWKPGDPLDKVTLLPAYTLTDGAYEPRSPLRFVADGSVAFRVTWGGHFMRYQRNLQSGALSVEPHPLATGFTNAASLLVHPRNHRLIAGLGYSFPNDGALQLHELAFPGFTLGKKLDSSNTNTGLLPDADSSCSEPWACGSFDVRALAIHPANRWLYAHFTQNKNPDGQSSLSVFELTPEFTGFGQLFHDKMTSKQKVIYPTEYGQGVSPSPDGKKLFVSSTNRLFHHDIDPLSGSLSAFSEVALSGPEVSGKTITLYEGVTCQIGSTYHHYTPLWTVSGTPTAGIWHTSFQAGQAQPSSSRVYSTTDAPGLARVRHLVATKDCSRLFVAGSQNTGEGQFSEGYRPELLAFNVDREDGSLRLESALRAGTDFSGVQREMLLSLSPDERHLYAGQEWSSGVAIFDIKHDNRGASTDKLTLQFGPEIPLQGVFLQNPRSDLYGNNECPAGQVLAGFSGLYNDCGLSCSYGRGVKRLSAVCKNVNVQPGAPPSVQFSPGMTGTLWGSWPQAQVPWGVQCPADQVAVGYRFLITQDKSWVDDIELHCAPLKIACSLPYQLEIDASNITVVSSKLPTSFPDPGRPVQMCPPGTLLRGALIRAGEIVDNMAMECSRPALAVSPGECKQDSDCEASDTCEGARCIQGLCESARRPFGAPARYQSATCTVECRGPGWTVHDLAEVGVPAGYFGSCGSCGSGEYNPLPSGGACSFGGGKECSSDGMCIQDWN